MIYICFILYIMWTCLGLLCINCMNDSYSAEEEWSNESYMHKTIFIIIAPILYLLVEAARAFKK